MIDDVIDEFPRPAVNGYGHQIIELHIDAGGALAFDFQPSRLDLGFRYCDGRGGCARGGQQEQYRGNYAQEIAARTP